MTYGTRMSLSVSSSPSSGHVGAQGALDLHFQSPRTPSSTSSRRSPLPVADAAANPSPAGVRANPSPAGVLRANPSPAGVRVPLPFVLRPANDTSAPPGAGVPRLAYLISGSKGDLDRLWLVLHALYHPRNQYVVHLDREAPVEERLELAARVANSTVFRRAGNVRVLRANPSSASASVGECGARTQQPARGDARALRARIELVLTGGWYIWWQRRRLVRGEPVQNPTRAALAIATLTTNFRRSLTKAKSERKREGWKKPPEGEILLNVDASFRPELGSGSTGAIIRDSTGAFLGARVNYFEHMADVTAAEVTGIREGLMLARLIGCNRIRIQSGCLEAVEMMKQGGFAATSSGPIFEECDLLCKEFALVQIDHCNREANVVAHELAKVALQGKLACNWVDEPSSFILGDLVNDVTIFAD